MLDLLDAAAALYVLELSSFQLERSELLEADVATVLNISPDHMDRYPDLASYAEAKRRVFRGEGLMVLNQDDPLVAAMYRPGRRVARFGLGSGDELDYSLARCEGRAWLLAKGFRCSPPTRCGSRAGTIWPMPSPPWRLPMPAGSTARLW